MNILIIGYGSIGARHASLLAEAGHQLTVVTQNSECPYQVSRKLEDALKNNFQGALVSVATSEHLPVLESLQNFGFKYPILVEKPLFAEPAALTESFSRQIHTAYNLRFHPLLTRAKELLAGRDIYSVMAYVGQHLPSWRPGRDYRTCYSANKEAGGGALRDLSHELDYLQWLAGPWQSVAAWGDHCSNLEISSDDIFGLMIKTEQCPLVQVQMNYLDLRPGGRREFIINADRLTLYGNFANGSLTVNGETPEIFSVERNQTYRDQLEAWLSEARPPLCSYAEGLETVTLVSAACEANQKRVWINK